MSHAAVAMGVDITVAGGAVHFTGAEAELFAALFTIVDSDGDDLIDGAQGAGAPRRWCPRPRRAMMSSARSVAEPVIYPPHPHTHRRAAIYPRCDLSSARALSRRGRVYAAFLSRSGLPRAALQVRAASPRADVGRRLRRPVRCAGRLAPRVRRAVKASAGARQLVHRVQAHGAGAGECMVVCTVHSGMCISE